MMRLILSMLVSAAMLIGGSLTLSVLAACANAQATEKSNLTRLLEAE